jgi:tetratricopeptide (TPR) repeat protein
LAIGLLEIIFFQDIDRLKSHQRLVGTLLLAGLSVFLVGLVLFIVFRGNPLDYLQRYYTERSFTLGQRIMTEPRVLVLYLSQLFYPVPERLSVVYDFQISTNLFVPWTTLPAILINVALIVVGVWQAPKRPLIAFGILFWFANHLVESTVLPLEIAFDHRNYLPSLFLFMAPSAGVVTLIDRFKHRNKILATALSAGMTVLIIAIGMGTYARNMAWQTQKSLWQDAALKHPGLARPVQKLAEIHQQEGQFQKAVKLYTRALDLRDPRPKQSRTLTLNNIGNIYYAQGSYVQAIQTFDAVLQIDEDYDRARFNLAQTLVAINRLAEALQQVEILLGQEADHPKFLNLKGHILIKINRPEAALTYFRDALRSAPGSRRTLVNIGVGYNAVGAYQKADWFFKRANQLDPADVVVLMRLIENALLADNTTAMNHYLERLFKYKSALEVLKLINALGNETRILPIDHHLIMAAASEYLRHEAIRLKSI